jgi:hypothetical protein
MKTNSVANIMAQKANSDLCEIADRVAVIIIPTPTICIVPVTIAKARSPEYASLLDVPNKS